MDNPQALQLTTERLRLRPVTLNYTKAIHQLHSLAEVNKFNTLGKPASGEETEKIVKHYAEAFLFDPIQEYTFAMELKEDQTLIGLIALYRGKPKYQSAEVWFKLFPKYWGKGYTTEALQTLLNFGFNQLNLHRIEAGCAVDNIASFKVLEKVGMKREGTRRQALPLASGWTDNYEYAVLATDAGE